MHLFWLTLAADLGRPAAEARLGDLALVRAEIDHAQLYLSEWMEDKHVRVPLALTRTMHTPFLLPSVTTTFTVAGPETAVTLPF